VRECKEIAPCRRWKLKVSRSLRLGSEQKEIDPLDLIEPPNGFAD
jgi:hypothetical protein